MSVVSSDHEKFEKSLADYVEANHIRRSSSRDAVFRLLMESESHVKLSELMRRSKRSGIGEATVYRGLKVFLQSGLVTRIQKGGKEAFYEVSREHHDHLICTGCGEVIEFHSPVIEKTQSTVARTHGFSIRSHRHEIYGLCKRCHRVGNA